MKLDNTLRITIISLSAAVPLYLALSSFMPLLSPDQLYGITAFSGVLIGLVLNFLWVKSKKKKGKQ